jgi:tetratricopeptide (TPR) repeat protein
VVTATDTLAAARMYLSQISATGDSAIALGPVVSEITERLEEAVRSGGDLVGDVAASYVLGWLYWHRNLAAPGTAEGAVEKIKAMVTLRPCFVAGLAPIPEELLGPLAALANDEAEDLTSRAVDSGDRGQLFAAIGLWQRMIASGESALADAELRGIRPPPDIDLDRWWGNLGHTVMARYELDGDRADLEAAIDAARKAADLTLEPGEDRARYLNNLATGLHRRALLMNSIRDRDEGLAVSAEAAQMIAADDPNRPGVLSSWGSSLLARYEETGVEADLAAAIDAYRDALCACAPDDLARGSVLTNLGNSLLRRFELTGSRDDLDQGVDMSRRSVEATRAEHPDFGLRLLNLSGSLRTRFGHLGEDADLDESIARAEQALAALGPDSPARAMVLHSLGGGLGAKFFRTGDLALLDAGIEAIRSAVDTAPETYFPRLGFIADLGGFLIARAEWTGSAADLDAVITILRQAASAASPGYLARPAILSYLGIALLDRARLPDAVPGLTDEAVEYGRQSVSAAPPGQHARATYLSRLALTLGRRADRRLAAGRFIEAARDLDEAIESCRAATECAVAPAERASRLADLSALLRNRSELHGDEADLNQALAIVLAAMETVPPEHHARASLLMAAGDGMRALYRRTGKAKTGEMAATLYMGAAEVGEAMPSVRIWAAKAAAGLTAKPNQTALLEFAVRLLPEVAPRQLLRADQQRQLGAFAALASDATALALADERRHETRAQRATRALALLEHGRGILLSQAFDTRSDVTELHARHPDLADRYRSLRDLLDRPAESAADVLRTVIERPGATSAGQQAGPDGPAAAALNRAQVARRFTETVAQIRGLDGFAGFMLPPAHDELIRAAVFGGTVIFNVSEYRSDALLVHPRFAGHIDYLPLPDLTPSALEEKIELFGRAQALRLGSPADPSQAQDPEEILLGILEWLWDVAAGPVLDALKYHGPPFPFGWWQVRWVPGGLLGQLPIHAAGYHRETPAGRPRTVMDRVISSYAPTLRALHYARGGPSLGGSSRVPDPDQPMRSLIVAMPTTPGSTDLDLRGVANHARQLRDLLPNAEILIQPDRVDPAAMSGAPTKNAVLSRLAGRTIVHFACHGLTDAADPSRSRLLLSDHETDPFTVAALASVRLDSAGLAYLSACSTALNEVTELADESIHLTSAFQLAGFPHVIGTLWEVDASVAEEVAHEFYIRMGDESGESGGYDLGRAALTLHHIVRELRDGEPDKPFTWAAYLHAGA